MYSYAPQLKVERSDAGKSEPGQTVLVAVDRVLAFAFSAAAAPVVMSAAVAIHVISRRSPFVAHLRIGKSGNPFWMWKLRTMWDRGPADAHEQGWVERIISEPVEDEKDSFDPRVISRFAAFCRRHSIDELPQLWHVVQGRMSLVGPRPLTRTEVDRYYGAHAPELLSLKPGLTGIWQICGRSAVRFPARASMDLAMVRSFTTKMYFSVLLRTLPALISGKGAW